MEGRNVGVNELIFIGMNDGVSVGAASVLGSLLGNKVGWAVGKYDEMIEGTFDGVSVDNDDGLGEGVGVIG